MQLSENGGNRELIQQYYKGFENSVRAWENNTGLISGLDINQGYPVSINLHQD